MVLYVKAKPILEWDFSCRKLTHLSTFYWLNRKKNEKSNIFLEMGNGRSGGLFKMWVCAHMVGSLINATPP